MSIPALRYLPEPAQRRDLPTSFQRQPGTSPRRRPEGIPLGVAATVLAALSLVCILAYGVASAIATQNGYAELRLKREIENLRAEESLLRFQVNLTRSQLRIAEAAQRLQLHLADPAREVDYVSLVSPATPPPLQTASRRESERTLRLLLASLTAQIMGRAEASTIEYSQPRP